MKLIERNPARRIPVTQPDRSRIDLSHYIMGSGQLGWLMPCGFWEMVPGDSAQFKASIKIDWAPVLRPFMTRVDAYFHYHWIPYRLCMPRLTVTNTDWESFIQGDPEDIFNNDVVPHVTLNNTVITAGSLDLDSLAGYFGLPLIPDSEATTIDQEINVLPFLAYWLTVDEYYRNTWLLDRICGPTTNWTVPLSGGDLQGSAGNIMPGQPFRVFYEMDYFGGATPQAYKGAATDVELDIDVYGDNSKAVEFRTFAGQALPGTGDAKFGGADELQDVSSNNLAFRSAVGIGAVASLEIMELRRTEALTRFLEAENRLGSDDYADWLLSIFGITNPDFRDKVPRYLGGGKLATNVSSVVNNGDVLQYNANTVQVPAGYQAGIAGITGSTNSVGINVTEFGLVLGLLSVVPRRSYGNQLERYWYKWDDRLDWYNPYFQNIGDQVIYEGEYGFQLTSSNTDTWAYQQRWAEYKYKQSYVVQDFLDTLDDFTMAKIHDVTETPDALSAANMKVDYTADEALRIFQNQSTTEHHLYYTVYHDAQFVRPMYLTDIPV